jgi:hypothetical protein
MLRALAALALFAAPGGKALSETQVVTFKPAAPPPGAKPVEGACFSNSIAVDRKGAWRCMIVNSIEDPCFSIDQAGAVVCGANPAQKNPGFLLKLTKPLPAEVKHGSPQPWLIELEDGTLCQALTGTLPWVKGDPVRWECEGKSPAGTYLSSLRPAKVWTAEELELAPSTSAGPQARVNPRKVTVRAVWK